MQVIPEQKDCRTPDSRSGQAGIGERSGCRRELDISVDHNAERIIGQTVKRKCETERMLGRGIAVIMRCPGVDPNGFGITAQLNPLVRRGIAGLVIYEHIAKGIGSALIVQRIRIAARSAIALF